MMDQIAVKAAPSVEEIFPTVRRCIRSSTGLKEENILLEKLLVKELKVDSIDLVDMVFSIEREYGISLAIGDLERRARNLAAPEPFAVDQKITPAGVQALKTLMPEVPVNLFRDDMLVPEIPLLFSVHTLCSMVHVKLTEKMNGQT